MIKFFIEPNYDVKAPTRDFGNAGVDFFIPNYSEAFIEAFRAKNAEKNANLMNAVAEVRGETVSGVPYIIVGNQSWNGFDESIGKEILDKIKAEYKAEERYDVMDYVDKNDIRKDGEVFLREQMNKYFPKNSIEYIV